MYIEYGNGMITSFYISNAVLYKQYELYLKI